MIDPTVTPLYSLEVNPEPGSGKSADLVSLFSNGVFVNANIHPFSLGPGAVKSQAFHTSNAKNMEIIKSRLSKIEKEFPKGGGDYYLPTNYLSPTFRLSLLGVNYSGDFFALKSLPPEILSDPSLAKAVRTLKAITSFSDNLMYFTHLFSDRDLSIRGSDIDYVNYLRPGTLSLLAKIRNIPEIDFVCSEERYSAIKNAAKIALGRGSLPNGKAYNEAYEIIASSCLQILNNSKTQAGFDGDFYKICEAILRAIGPDYSFVEAAGWLDFTYAELLLGQHYILDERKAVFCHYPVNEGDLLFAGHSPDRKGYLLRQSETRKDAIRRGATPLAVYFLNLLKSSAPSTIEKVGPFGAA